MKFVEDWKHLKAIAKANPGQRVRMFTYDLLRPMRFMCASDALAYMRGRLHMKISRPDERPANWRNVEAYDQMMDDVAHDRRRVHEYEVLRLRHTGSRNLLRHPHYKQRYPHIDNQPRED